MQEATQVRVEEEKGKVQLRLPHFDVSTARSTIQERIICVSINACILVKCPTNASIADRNFGGSVQCAVMKAITSVTGTKSEIRVPNRVGEEGQRECPAVSTDLGLDKDLINNLLADTEVCKANMTILPVEDMDGIHLQEARGRVNTLRLLRGNAAAGMRLLQAALSL